MSRYVCLRTDVSKEELDAAILSELGNGPVKSFGCNRNIDAALKRLKKQGKIVHKFKNQGGNGWELVK